MTWRTFVRGIQYWIGNILSTIEDKGAEPYQLGFVGERECDSISPDGLPITMKQLVTRSFKPRRIFVLCDITATTDDGKEYYYGESAPPLVYLVGAQSDSDNCFPTTPRRGGGISVACYGYSANAGIGWRKALAHEEMALHFNVAQSILRKLALPKGCGKAKYKIKVCATLHGPQVP